MMKKSVWLGAVLAGVLAAVPVMAQDSATGFHALRQLPLTPTLLSETQLATIEGGHDCSSGGVATGGLISIPIAANALNCSNVAVVLQANVSALNIGIGGSGSGNQENFLDKLSQEIQ